MYRNRRSFARELLALISDIENEFSGQIKILPFDETDMLSILFEITPSKGLYAHASFIFRVETTASYPFQRPKISCLTNIFHPNITSETANNICLNLINNWLPRYGLKDILSALLFLLYEPNFEDPINANASKPEEGLTMELTILKSLMGGTVNGVYYVPNEAWCRWAEQNNISVKFPSRSEKNVLEKSCGLSIQSPGQPKSTLSGFFCQALSGQFTPMARSTYENWPQNSVNEYPITFALSRQITIKTNFNFTCDIKEAVHDARRYYYTELGGFRHHWCIDDLIAKSACVSTMDFYELDLESEHTSVIELWPEPMERTMSVVSDDILTHDQYLQNETNSDDDQTNNSTFVYSEYDSHSDENEEQMESEPDVHNSLSPEAADSTVPDIPEQQHCDVNEETNEPLRIYDTIVLHANEEPHESVLSELQEAVDCLTPSVLAEHEHEEQQQQQTDDDNFESNNSENIVDTAEELDQCISCVESEYFSSFIFNINFSDQKREAAKAEPWFWMLYQTRWPPYLAPNRITEINCAIRKSNMQRASSKVLRSDLFRVGNRCNGHRLFILVDSLSISPFSPIVNRAVCFRPRNRKVVAWYSLDWISVWDVFKSSLIGRSSSTQSNHFRLPAVLFGLCYAHNWVAYLSRMELYGLCLGYSRPWKNSMVNYTAATCLIPATLGCGQCGLLGVWPLWLAWRSIRWLCHLLSFWVTRDIPRKQNLHVSRPKMYFPFSDLNEI